MFLPRSETKTGPERLPGLFRILVKPGSKPKLVLESIVPRANR